jgi:hypothetical protein
MDSKPRIVCSYAMQNHDRAIVRVYSAWDSWHCAEVRLTDLRDLHWSQPGHAPHRLLHAFLSCTKILSGDLAHTCDRTSAPHALLVCVLKRHTVPEAYSELVRRADLVNGRAHIATGARHPSRRPVQLSS